VKATRVQSASYGDRRKVLQQLAWLPNQAYEKGKNHGLVSDLSKMKARSMESRGT
jgi:hypothetical protein